MPRSPRPLPSNAPRKSLRLSAVAATLAALLASPAALAQQAPPPATFGYVPPPTADFRFGAPDAPPAAAFVPAAQIAPRPDAPSPPPKKSEREVAFDLAAVTELPIMVGAQATLEVPYRLLLQGEVGLLPAAFVNAVDGALVGAGAYSAGTSELVRGGLGNSLVVRLSGGWRPFADHGFEIMGGYTLTSFGGGMSARTAVETAAGITLPAQTPDAQIPLHSTVHSVHVSLGWRWVVADHFVIRASLAYLQAVSSSSHVDLPAGVVATPAIAAQLAQVNQSLDTILDDTYKTYVKLPVVGLSMGYRF